MKERPILFSSDMVKAILDGRKTMTRRVIKFPFVEVEPDRVLASNYHDPKTGRVCGTCYKISCPYGQPGDRLWVREAWRVGAWAEDDGKIAVDYKAGPVCRTKWLTVPDPDKFNDLWEGSTQEAEAVYGIKERYKWKPGESPCRWRPSLFMPRWASRITLEITEVRVERVQDISEKDAKAEGVNDIPYMLPGEGGVRGFGPDSITRPRFRALWNSLNAKRGYGWDSNCYVWVLTFKKV